MTTDQLLQAAFYALNEIPNKEISGEFKNSYALAAALGNHLRKEDDASYLLTFTLRTTYKDGVKDNDYTEIFCDESEGRTPKQQAHERMEMLRSQYDSMYSKTEMYTWNIAKITSTSEHYNLGNEPAPVQPADDLVTLERGAEIKQEQPSLTFEVRSSHGTLTAAKSNGAVVNCVLNDNEDEDGHSLLDITKFDVKEFRTYHNIGIDAMPDSIDILDLGYWYDNGIGLYESPDGDWREMMINIADD
jgi:hypothetical protein